MPDSDRAETARVGAVIKQPLVAAPVSAHLYTEPERTADRVFESFYGCKMVRMYCCPCGTGWGAGDLGFDVADGPAAVGSAVCELPSAVVVGFSEECFAVALRESPAVDQFDRLIGQLEPPRPSPR